MKPLADSFVTVYESPDPPAIYCYSPGICRCPDGRLIATCDLGGPGVARLPGVKSVRTGDMNLRNQGKIFTSDDHGKTWTHRADFPFWHARPFVAGSSVYVLGQDGDLSVVRSDDNGTTWGATSTLTDGQRWGQAPCNVHYANGNIYLVMERRLYDDVAGWQVSVNAPVLMRGRLGDDLTKREHWTFANPVAFRDIVKTEDLRYVAVPFFESRRTEATPVGGGRTSAPIGWCETNIVQFVDPDHYWYDPSGHTFHLWARCHSGGTGYAGIEKVIEQPDGTMKTTTETAPSGHTVVLVPCPGGQMKFHILYDAPAKLYWLLSSQATDSMTRADRLPPDRFSLPNNERHRLQLHFSKNCIDWSFAGMVAIGPSYKQSRHYASMVIDGDDLQVLSRSGDERAANAHNGNLITLHTIHNFRELAY
jgi:hypothetical protein